MHGELDKSKNKNPRDANFVRPPTGSLHKSYVRVCTCIVHWQCANNTKTTFPQCTGSLTKAKNKNPRDADFVRPPTGSLHKSYVRVCTCIVHWQCANNTKTTLPHCTGSLTKAKNKNPRDADFVRPPTGSLHKSYVRVCTCIVHWQCANNTKTTFPQCTGSLTKAKIKIRATRILSGHPRGRYTSPTCVYALVLYIGNAQTTQKQHSHNARGAWQKQKIKIRATRILSGHPRGRYTSPTYVYALVLYIGNAQTTQKQHSHNARGA